MTSFLPHRVASNDSISSGSSWGGKQPQNINPLKISITPENPMIFLNREFSLQVAIEECQEEIQWLSAQIIGTISSLKSSTAEIIQMLANDTLGLNQNSSSFDHVSSGSRFISTKVRTPKTYVIFITANNVPPSYNGEGITISYKLRLTSQIINQPIHIFEIPLCFIAPYRQYTSLLTVQNNFSIDLQAKESNSIYAPFAQTSPFIEEPDMISEEFIIKNAGVAKAKLEMKVEYNIGTEIMGNIEFLSNCAASNVKVQVIRNEIYEASGLNEKVILGTQLLDLRKTLMKRFSIPITFDCTANFATNFFNVNFLCEFLFSDEESTWTWTTPIRLFPPVLSLSTPRSCIT